MSEPLVSVIMPIRNGEIYLKPCLDSIISQSIDDWEVICIDDGCEDNSMKIISDYGDPRFRIIQNNGKGIADALCAGLEQSNGKFVSRMDCDDIMHVNKLERMSDSLKGENRKNVVITSLVKYFSDSTLGQGYREYEGWLNAVLRDNRVYDEIYKECTIPSPSWMVRKSDILEYDLLNDLGIPEDYEMCFRFYTHEFHVEVLDEKLHFWRDHDHRITRNDSSYDIRRFTLFKLKKFLDLELKDGDELVIWGAGNKGKEMARYLSDIGSSFTWITDNPKKQEIEIYGTTLTNPEILLKMKQPKVIVAVSNKEEQRTITDFLMEVKRNGELKYFPFF